MSDDIIKIIMTGLDNSGKTSIIYTLEQRFASIYALKPTVSFTVREDFKILGLPIKIWDLGGQKQYRDEYLTKKGFIFEETNLIFFVIDIQDPKRFSEAIEYFENSIEFLVKLGQPPVIIALLHKTDPEIRYTPKIRKNISRLQDLFYRKLTSRVDIEFFETSIFNREDLSKAFIAGIMKAIPKATVIKEALADFMKNSDSLAVSLLDENVLILAEQSIDEKALNICQISGVFFANMTERLLNYKIMPPTVLEAQIEDGWLFQKPIRIDGNRFYLVFFTKERSLEKINKLLPSITKDLSNLIKYVI